MYRLYMYKRQFTFETHKSNNGIFKTHWILWIHIIRVRIKFINIWVISLISNQWNNINFKSVLILCNPFIFSHTKITPLTWVRWYMNNILKSLMPSYWFTTPYWCCFVVWCPQYTFKLEFQCKRHMAYTLVETLLSEILNFICFQY